MSDFALGVVTTSWSHDDTVATLTLDRPAKLNAFTPVMIDQLRVAAQQLIEDPPRLVLLRSAGDKVFCVGADISLFSQLTPVQMWKDWTGGGHRAFQALEDIPCPTLAVVDGLAYGGGLEVALACDFRILRADARLALPETGLGTVPGWGGTARTTALIGPSRAKEMIMTRRPVEAAQALDWGLVNAVVDPDGLDDEVERWVSDLAAGSPITSAMAKQAVTAASQGAPAAIVESLAGGLSIATDDLREGVAAFREKRQAEFPGS
ncbi:enoyl-CoA hydratase/isomerase family protein [Brachybacterium sp.]|uniref:enoyl-CoA hydratase/isomerase family protein n=1 Tax=Brachybacterium sp. TaxID=1891286 RepID=UPI003F92E821